MTIDLAYTDHGDRQAPALVLLGSIGSDSSMWAPQVHALSGRYRVLCVDLRGHGKSPAPRGPYTMADLGADVVALLDSLELASVHLVGLSLGGAVAQWLAAHRCERVRTLTLLCTSARFAPAQQWLDRAEIVRSEGLSSIADAIVARWFTPELAERDPELVRRHREMVCATSDEGYAGCCEALASWDGRADLARIIAPTLVIAGAQDPATPPATLQAIADGIADARLHVLGPAAHLASREQAGPVNALIARHIGSVAWEQAATHATGMTVRRAVLGDAHVDRAVAAITEFTAPFQDFITRTAWGDIWNRPGLDHHTRRLLTLAILTAVGNEHELDMHTRAALRAGVDPAELVEVFLHTAIYAGVPNSHRAFTLGRQALADMAEQGER